MYLNHKEYDDILNIDQACELLRIGKGKCYEDLRTGRLKGFQLGKTWKIPFPAIIEYVKKH